MSETVINERLAIKEKRKELYAFLDTHIPCENIRQYIFGGIESKQDIVSVLHERSIYDYPKYMSNVLSLTFIFLYACYRRDMSCNTCAVDLTNQNARRVIDSMRDAFVKFPVTQELIQFVLTDVQFELARGEGSELDAVFGNMSATNMSQFSFNPYFKLIAEYNKCPGRFQYSKLELIRLFHELLEKMTFLSNYALVSKTADAFAFVAHSASRVGEKFAVMKIPHILFRDDARYLGGIYHLFTIERVEDEADTILLRYLNAEEDRSLIFSVPCAEDAPNHLANSRPKHICNEILGRIPWEQSGDEFSQKKTANKIDQIHTINYKYIRNLALAVSDAISINAGCKMAVYKRFQRFYPYIFERTKAAVSAADSEPYEDPSLDWDSIIVMLLIEASPPVVLEFVISKNRQTLYDICKNLYKRIYDSDETLEIFNQKPPVIAEAVRRIITEKLIVGEAGGFGKIQKPEAYKEKLFPRAAAMFILSKLTALQQETEAEENLIYTGNLRNNISLLQKGYDGCEKDRVVRYACIILGETIKHIMCFYSGVFKYGEMKTLYDMEARDKCLSKARIAEFQKSSTKEFLRVAKTQATAMKDVVTNDPSAVFALFKTFIRFCEECQLANNVLPERSKNLYAAVGRYEIINVRVLNKFYAALQEHGSDVFTCNADEWIKTTLTILEYFKTGSMPDTPRDSDLFKAVYPFTAVFNKGRENLDGYKTVNFSLNIDIDDDNVSDYRTEINVLSEFSYNRSEVYYCLPNVLRSNYKWWIDPILINFREFNAIFAEEET